MFRRLISVILASLCFTSVDAHPTDTDELYHIGVGTQLTIIKDINILPYKHSVSIGKAREPGKKERSCTLSGAGTNYDSVIPAGTTYKIENIDFDLTYKYYAYDRAVLSTVYYKFTIDSERYELRCRAYQGMTIGEFKSLIKEFAQVQIAPPIRVK